MALLRFLEALGQPDYLSLPEGRVVTDYLLKLSQWDSSVSLPGLIRLLCEPGNTSAFVVLSDSATEVALREQALGQRPYLSTIPSGMMELSGNVRVPRLTFSMVPVPLPCPAEGGLLAGVGGGTPGACTDAVLFLHHLFDVAPEFVSPQHLLSHLVLYAVKPYRENTFGVSSLRLLQALGPITALRLVASADVDQLWSTEIPQMLQMLYEHTEKSLDQEEWEDRLLQFYSRSLEAISDDSWLEQQTVTTLERIENGSDEEEQKAFLYKFFAFTLRTSSSPDLVRRMLSAVLNASHEEPQQREGIAVALAIVSLRHLRVALDQLEVYGANLTDKDRSCVLTLTKEHQHREWGLVCSTVYLSYRKIISVTEDALSLPLDSILALAVEHYGHCIVEKDTTLTLAYLDALTQMTSFLGERPMPLPCEVPPTN
nr:maestro heat-like repeat-containing protein family member 1 [Microcebus murinus]